MVYRFYSMKFHGLPILFHDITSIPVQMQCHVILVYVPHTCIKSLFKHTCTAIMLGKNFNLWSEPLLGFHNLFMQAATAQARQHVYVGLSEPSLPTVLM